MGKKSRRNRPGGGGNKKKGSSKSSGSVHDNNSSILSPEERRVKMDRCKANFIRLSAEAAAADHHHTTDIGFTHRYREAKRFWELVGYCCHLGGISTKEDYKFFKNLCKATTSTSTPACIRAEAFYEMGKYKQRNLEYDDAIHCMYTALQIYSEAQNDPREIRPIDGNGQDVLNAMQQQRATKVSSMNKLMLFDRDGNSTNDFQLMDGKHCDACGMTWIPPSPPNNNNKDDDKKKDYKVLFKCCGKCQMAFYCSEECQRSHWNQIHKQQCRMPGEFQVGDFAYWHFVQPPSEDHHGSSMKDIIICGHVVELIRWEEETKTWYVIKKKHIRSIYVPFGCRPLTETDLLGRSGVQTKNLRRIRPVLWKALSQASFWKHLDDKVVCEEEDHHKVAI